MSTVVLNWEVLPIVPFTYTRDTDIMNFLADTITYINKRFENLKHESQSWKYLTLANGHMMFNISSLKREAISTCLIKVNKKQYISFHSYTNS